MENIYEKIPELIRSNSKLVIVTVVHTSGSTPRESGAKMVILPDGTIEGTIGGGKLEYLIIEDAKAALHTGNSTLKKYNLKSVEDSGIGMECGGEVTVFIEVIKKGERILVLGGGHIGLALYSMAIETGFSIVIVDDRPEFVTKERFPKAEILLNCTVDDPSVARLVDKVTYIVIVTHEHKQDKLALKSLINLDYKYLGMIGSKRKVEQTLEELENEGVPKEKLNNVYTPIGLDIKAETPAEIAVSILAEIINVKRAGEPSEISLLRTRED
jgi:xanthine dehydrogenase accessory factor